MSFNEDAMFSEVIWEPVGYTGDDKITPHVTMQGVMRIGEIEIKVFQLSNGKRVLAKEDVDKFFGMDLSELIGSN